MADGPPTNLWDWLLPTFVDSDTVKQYQAAIDGMRRELVPYGQYLSPTRMSSWRATNSRVDAYIAIEPSFMTAKAQLIAGDIVKAELEGWRAEMRLAAPKGEGPPKPSYDKPQSPFPQGSGMAIGLVVFGVIAAVVLSRRR